MEKTFAIVLALFACGYSGWTPYPGPAGGTLASLAVSGNTLFARTEGAVYRSPDSGGSWIRIAGDPDGADILSLAVRDSAVFYGTRTGIFRSRDGGRSWARADDGIPDTSVSALEVFAPHLAFARTGAGVFRSQDDGDSWERLGDPYFPEFTLGDSALFALYETFVYRSRDRGQSWVRTAIGPSTGGVTDLAKLGSILIASSRSIGLYRSEDGGNSWAPDFGGLPSYDIQELFAGDSVLFANVPDGTIRSADKGATWAYVDGSLDGMAMAKLAALGSTLIAGAKDDGGMFRSGDNGKSWEYLEHALTRRGLRGLYPTGSGLFAYTANTVFRSRDEGGSWERVLAFPGITSFGAGGGALFVGANDGVHRSRDHGATWVRLTGIQGPVSSLAFLGPVLAIASAGGVMRSLDEGDTWSPSEKADPYLRMDFLAAGGSAFFAAGRYANETYRSLDSGKTWSLSLRSGGVRYLAASGSTVFASTSPGNLYRSVDNGASWRLATFTYSMFESLVISGSSVFAGSWGDGVYNTRDNGDSWNRFYEGAPTVYTVLAAKDSMLICGLSSAPGAWMRPFSELASGTGLKRRASPGIALGGIVRHGREVRFSLAAKSRARLEVFDSRGRSAAVLLDAVLDAGEHQAELDFEGPPGLYFLRFTAAGSGQTRAFVWAK
jgi:photosystem II stability/assembly factor-like uncharacterized protein